MYAGWFWANQVVALPEHGLAQTGLSILTLAACGLLGLRQMLFSRLPRGLRILGWMVAALTVGMHVRGHIIERVRIVGESMAPTYVPGSVLWVEKLSVGLLLPELSFPFGSPWPTGMFPTFGYALPARGAVVVARLPESDAPIIKRVAALPGEAFTFHGHQTAATSRPGKGSYRLPDKHAALLGPVAREAILMGCPEQGVVPPGTVLLLGDNEALSRDSRVFGFVPIFYLRGVVIGAKPNTRR